jgi:hypothetical protein
MTQFKSDVYLEGVSYYEEYPVPATIEDDGTLTISAKYDWFLLEQIEERWFIRAWVTQGCDPDDGYYIEFVADSNIGRELIKRGLVYSTEGATAEGSTSTFDVPTFDKLHKAGKLPELFVVDDDDALAFAAMRRVTLAYFEAVLAFDRRIAQEEAEAAEQGEAIDAVR